MSVLHITKENFESEVLHSDVPVLVDFFATWCGPCKMVAPIIDEIASEREDVKVCKIDVDQDTELAIRYNVSSIPTLMVFSGGDVIKQSLGALPKKEILAMLP
jgi:thioredoxin 1